MAAVVATEADVVVMAAVAAVAPVSAVLVAEAGVQPCRQHSTALTPLIVYPNLRHGMATGPYLGVESDGDCQLGHGEGGS